MSIHAMIVGALQDSSARDGTRGKYVLATIRVTNQNVVTFWKVFSSDKHLGEKLLTLDVGDIVAVSGPAKFELWSPDGAKSRINFAITADQIASLPSQQITAKAQKLTQPTVRDAVF